MKYGSYLGFALLPPCHPIIDTFRLKLLSSLSDIMSRSSRSRLSEEQLLKAVQKKRECNAKAQAIVVSFLERNIEQDYFLEMLKDINQSHYDDIVDERHILMLCGYPLCSTQLESIPTKKYSISVTKNKVYDITDRKKFCSASCFKASEFIKSQILVSPLWLRQYESTPQFKLLNKNDD